MTRIEERLVSRWSPYELNAGAILILAPMMAILFAGIVLLPSLARAVLVVPLFGGLAATYWLMLIGLCPRCNKSPMVIQYGQGKLAEFLRLRRAWPEQRCSSCSCDLTVIPE